MKRSLQLIAATLLIASFSQAHADWLSVYAAAKLDSVNGTGEVFENLKPGMAGGLEAGIEVIGIEVWGEAIWMADSQAMYSGNLGFDLTFGTDLRVNAGIFTGPIFFQMGEPDSSGIQLSDETNQYIDAARVANPGVPSGSEIENAYNLQYGASSSQLESLAFGWNLVRTRLQIEYRVIPFGYLGIGGQYGYHITFSGDDITNEAKIYALDELRNADGIKDIPPEQQDQLIDALKKDLGVEETDTKDLNGTNFNVGVYFKLEI
ncbi:MAG: hypothetical protein ACPGQS_13580 [Bradymonadia bacterium]